MFGEASGNAKGMDKTHDVDETIHLRRAGVTAGDNDGVPVQIPGTVISIPYKVTGDVLKQVHPVREKIRLARHDANLLLRRRPIWLTCRNRMCTRW